MPTLDATYEELEKQIRLDFTSAWQTRRLVENRKLDYYSLYRAFRDDVPGGGQTESATGAGRGPFNWSRLTVPLVYITVESFISRLAPEAPTVTVTPRTLAAVAYAQAKQMRINRDLEEQDWFMLVVEALKDAILIGDGITKTTWRPHKHGRSGRPVVVHVPWQDFFISPEALKIDDAEVLYHRTWHSRRSLADLADQRDDQGNPLYENVEDLTWHASRESLDDTWQRRRILSGQDSVQIPYPDTQQVAIVEAWYQDGTIATFGWGGAQVVILRHVANPYVDTYGSPVRPFVPFSNTPDPNSPYAISDGEMVEDCQREAQVIIDQSIDAAARNIMNPTFYNRNRIDQADVQAALATPGGLGAVDGNPSDFIYQPPPVSLSRDSEATVNRIIQLSQMITGISDESQTPFEGPRPGDDTGATGAWIRSQDRNRRVQYKLMLIAIAVRGIAKRIDWIDRVFRAGEDMVVPVTHGFQPQDGAEGVKLDGGGRVAVVSADVNGDGLDYDVKVDAGSLEAPFAGEQAARANQLAAQLSASPMLAQQVNWGELARMLVEASNFEPDRILVPAGQGQPLDQAGMVPGQNGAGGLPDQPVPGMPPGSTPVGEPVPVGAPDMAAAGMNGGGGATGSEMVPYAGAPGQLVGQPEPVQGGAPMDMQSGMQMPAMMPEMVVPHVTLGPGSVQFTVEQMPQPMGPPPTIDLHVHLPSTRKVITFPDGRQAYLDEIPVTAAQE